MCQENCFCGDSGGTIPATTGNTWQGKASDLAIGGVALVEGLDTELLVRLLSRHQEELFRYIYSLLPHEADARDVLQETSVALYRKFGEYDPHKPFLAWAYGFAHMEVLKQRERNQRGLRLWNQEVLERLARERQQMEPLLEVRLQALEHCLRALSPADQALVRQRYEALTRRRADGAVRQEPADPVSRAQPHPPPAVRVHPPPHRSASDVT